MKLFVLAGGFGTRLKSVVSEVPKPLAPINGIPFLQLQMEHWIAQGQRDFVFMLHHQADIIIQFLKSFEKKTKSRISIEFVVEETPLGTGGAIAFAASQLKMSEMALVTNADTWLGTGLAHMRTTNDQALSVVKVADAARFGTIQFTPNMNIQAFLEKTGACSPGWINAGLYKLDLGKILPQAGRAFSLEEQVFPDYVAKGELNAVPLDTCFLDIGVPADYQRFCDWQKNKGTLTP